MLVLLSHPGHGFMPGHFHPSDATIVALITMVAVLLVLMTRDEE